MSGIRKPIAQGGGKSQFHLSKQRASGLSVAAYCRRSGVRESTFYYWRHRERERAVVRTKARASFVEVVSSSIPRVEYRIAFSNGIVLHASRGFDAAEVRELSGILTAAQRC